MRGLTGNQLLLSTVERRCVMWLLMGIKNTVQACTWELLSTNVNRTLVSFYLNSHEPSPGLGEKSHPVDSRLSCEQFSQILQSCTPKRVYKQSTRLPFCWAPSFHSETCVQSLSTCRHLLFDNALLSFPLLLLNCPHGLASLSRTHRTSPRVQVLRAPCKVQRPRFSCRSVYHLHCSARKLKPSL